MKALLLFLTCSLISLTTLAQRYADDPRLHPGDQIESHTPFGEEFKVDLRARESR